MYFVELMDSMLTSFMGPAQDKNDLGTTDHHPRGLFWNFGTIGKMVNFAQTLYNLTK